MRKFTITINGQTFYILGDYAVLKNGQAIPLQDKPAAGRFN